MSFLAKFFRLFLREKETKNEEPRVRFLKPGESSKRSGELRDIMLAQNYPGDMGKEVQTVIVDSTGKPVNAQKPKAKPVNTSQPKAAPANAPKPNEVKQSLTLEERYGKVSLIGYRTKKWNDVKVEYQKLEDAGLAEASLALGNFASLNGKDTKKALEHFRKAAARGLAAGAEGAARMIVHSQPPEINGKDKEWYKYCLQAAQGGCSQSMYMLGDMYNKLNDYLAAFYWYQMSAYYEHTKGSDSANEILSKYLAAGKPALSTRIDGVRLKDVQNVTKIFRCLTKQDPLNNEKMMEFVNAAMEDDNEIMGLFIGYYCEHILNVDSNAKIGYQLAAHNNSIIGMKCLADMMVLGKGCEKNLQAATEWYKAAADAGEKTACFIMGELTKEKNPYLAAYYYEKAKNRGHVQALFTLMKM